MAIIYKCYVYNLMFYNIIQYNILYIRHEAYIALVRIVCMYFIVDRLENKMFSIQRPSPQIAV